MTTPAAASDLQSLRPLAGRSLVVMRPREQAESLCARIEAAGGHALRFPVIAVGPALDPAPLQAIVGRLDEFDLAFFVSPNAVDHAMRAILPQRAWPARLRVATVGKGMSSRKGVSATLFTALAEADINIRLIDQGSSEMNIIVGVLNRDFEKAIRAIYGAFIGGQK